MSLAGMAIWKTAFQLSPIFLVGGNSWVSQTVGATIPIILLTEPLSLISSLLSGVEDKELDAFFAHWEPLAGTTLIDNQVAMYPFANQAVAANALITQPLQVSMRMICPVKTQLGYGLKLATMEALQTTLADHNRSGGTYTVLTPSFVFINCLMTRMVDVSAGESAQRQHTWQFDFVRPLLTVETAISQGNTNPLMTTASNGGQIDPTTLTSGQSAQTGIESAPSAATSGFSDSGLVGPNPAGTSIGAPAGTYGGSADVSASTLAPTSGNTALEPIYSSGNIVGYQQPGFGTPAPPYSLTP